LLNNKQNFIKSYQLLINRETKEALIKSKLLLKALHFNECNAKNVLNHKYHQNFFDDIRDKNCLLSKQCFHIFLILEIIYNF
jgi:hypothetical protein